MNRLVALVCALGFTFTLLLQPTPAYAGPETVACHRGSPGISEAITVQWSAVQGGGTTTIVPGQCKGPDIQWFLVPAGRKVKSWTLQNGAWVQIAAASGTGWKRTADWCYSTCYLTIHYN